RIAAFGLIEDVPQYETAQVHVILAADKLHHPDDARIAARRFAAAERLDPAYASLHLDPAMRHDFEALLPTLLTPKQLARLPSLSRASSLEVARGLHRTSALKESSALYQKLYPLQHGEEQHMLAEAVNRYELGDLTNARVLLGRSLSGVSRTPELSLYLP